MIDALKYDKIIEGAIHEMLTDGCFFKVIKIMQSPMDRHCFMHSILSALLLQNIGTNAFSDLNMNQLISMIKEEAVSNENRYLQFFVRMSRLCFFGKLDNYFENKRYNSAPIYVPHPTYHC